MPSVYCLLNFSKGFVLGITKLLTKFDCAKIEAAMGAKSIGPTTERSESN